MSQFCPHLWKRVRNPDGRVQTRSCTAGCDGSRLLDVFECRCPGRRQSTGNDHVSLETCQSCLYRPRIKMPSARSIVFKNHLSPGDILCMTAAVRCLHEQHPGKFLTAVDTTSLALWENNPDVVPLTPEFRKEACEVWLHTDKTCPNGVDVPSAWKPKDGSNLINRSNQSAVHMMMEYTDLFERALNVRVDLTVNRPQLYLTPEEKGWLPQVQEITGRATKYVVVCAGRKSCYTAKFWGAENYQRVVDLLRGRVLFVQVGAAEHHHPLLRNVLSLVGKTDLRQLVRLVHHSEGGLGGTTLLMHLCAALERPYVCIAGGREPVPWNSYPLQQHLHTVGALPCCREGGCWKSRTVMLGDGAEQDSSLCEAPVYGEESVPRCLALIRPEQVAEKILLTMQ